MSNPIASETPHGTVLHEGHYGPVHCHCSECDYLVDSAEAKSSQTAPAHKTFAWWMNRAVETESELASLRQQLSDRNAMYEGMLERAAELAKKELTEAQGKVSQLEAELAKWKDHYQVMFGVADEEREDRMKAESQVSVLTKERDELVPQRNKWSMLCGDLGLNYKRTCVADITDRLSAVSEVVRTAIALDEIIDFKESMEGTVSTEVWTAKVEMSVAIVNYEATVAKAE